MNILGGGYYRQESWTNQDIYMCVVQGKLQAFIFKGVQTRPMDLSMDYLNYDINATDWVRFTKYER